MLNRTLDITQLYLTDSGTRLYLKVYIACSNIAGEINIELLHNNEFFLQDWVVSTTPNPPPLSLLGTSQISQKGLSNI